MLVCMFDYDAVADLYFGRQGVHARKAPAYRRFARASAALQFAVEQLTSKQLDYALLEVDEGRFDAAEIRLLYASAAYPLARKSAQ